MIAPHPGGHAMVTVGPVSEHGLLQELAGLADAASGRRA
jgi:hypothetical protein